jgi:hypothetical protein
MMPNSIEMGLDQAVIAMLSAAKKRGANDRLSLDVVRIDCAMGACHCWYRMDRIVILFHCA